MTGAIEKLTLYAPVVASSGVFALRRINRGLDAMDDNPYFGTANFVIAGGQTLKGLRAAESLTQLAKAPSAAKNITATSNAIKGIPVTSKFLKTLGWLFDFTSDHINPLICVASGIKVLGSDDKADAAVREALGLGLMFTAENATKAFIGMPIIKKNVETGVRETIKRTPYYKTNPFLKAQAKALEDLLIEKQWYQAIKKSSIPGALKGVIFVLASITGYKLGSKLADAILGKEVKNTPEMPAAHVVVSTVPAQAISYVHA